MKRILLSVLLLSILLLAACGGGAPADSYAPGNLGTQSYDSDWLSIVFTPGADMVLSTREEMNELMNLTAEQLKADGAIADVSAIATVYEMMATNILDNSNVIVMAEKLAYENLSEDQYITALKEQFAATGFTFTYEEVTETVLAGETYKNLSYRMEMNGVSVCQTMLIRKIGDRMAALSFTYPDTASRDALYACFTPKNP